MRVAACVVWLIAGALRAHGQDRLVRTFSTEHGLTGPVWALAQDSVGFLWVGTENGLFRFDGSEFRRWAADSIFGRVYSVTVAPDGRIAAVAIDGRAFEVTAAGAHGISPPVRHATYLGLVYDRRGVLWRIDGRVVAQLLDNQWRTVPSAWIDGEEPRRLRANRAGAIDILTRTGVWRIVPDSAPRRLIATPYPFDVLSFDDGRTIVLIPGAVVEVSDSGQRRLTPGLFPPGRDIALAERNGTIWVGRDHALVAVRPGEAPELVPFSGRVTYGGPLLVDREGSLWVGSNALHQLPEPETSVRTEVSGLNLRYGRFVEKTGSTVWFGTWVGQFSIRRTPSGWAATAGVPSLANLCTDAAGSTWTMHVPADGPSTLVEINDGTLKRHPIDGPRRRTHGCAAAAGGGVWIGTNSDIFKVGAGVRDIRAIPVPADIDGSAFSAWLHDSRDRLWVTVGSDRICRAPVVQLLDGVSAAWACDTIPGWGGPGGIVEMPSGTVWAGADAGGLVAYGPEGWKPVPMDGMPTRTVFALVPSPRGGVWIAGHGILHRMQERPDRTPELLERLTHWHGVPGPGAADVLEEADGTMWIAYDGGIVRVPGEVRFAAPPVPRVALVEASVDGVPVDERGRFTLPHHRNRVELRFAALSFRDPAQLQHQVRLAPDEPWSESRRSPSFRWVDLRPGKYQVEYRASLDGRNWTADPVRLVFTVLHPWYATPWSIGLGLLILFAVGWLLYRTRVAYLLGLERQRTRIAMDLHDEIGSGLASVGILSGVLAADSLDPDERRRAAGEIASASEDLGNALSDIVWSLDPHTATLAELASRLAEHGERLCATGDILFATRFPESWPPDRIDVALRRNILLVGLEALHNAVRHARAHDVLLALLPVDGGWQLTVRDDGIGMYTVPTNGRGGHGLRGMRRRASEIGGQLALQSAPGQGTTVTLRFTLHPRSVLRTAALVTRIHHAIRALIA